MKNQHLRLGSDSGYAYIEVLIAMVLIATSLAPMLESLAQGVRMQTQQSAEREALHFTISRMEETLSRAYAELDAEAALVASAVTPTAYSDAAGTQYQRDVYLARYDIDNADADNNPFTGGDPGLLWIRVASTNGRFDLQHLLAAP